MWETKKRKEYEELEEKHWSWEQGRIGLIQRLGWYDSLERTAF